MSLADLVDHKQAALDRLRELRAKVESLPAEAGARELADLTRYLERAIEAFHMEAIRFRMYTIGRRMGQVTGLPEEAASFDQLRSSLEAAGFHTRSVS